MANPEQGRYFVIEGGDGTGKSTQLDLAIQHLEGLGQDVERLREPGGTPIGDAIRQILKSKEFGREPETDVDLFTACRREIVAQVLGPMMLKGRTAVSDRNWFSTVAYQGFGKGVDIDYVLKRSEEAMGQYFMPSGVVIIDIPVEVASKRKTKQGDNTNDHFENLGFDFQQRVRDGYLWLADRYDVPLLDGAKPVEEVHRDIIQHFDA